MIPERLQQLSRYGVCLDTETHKIQPGLNAPPMVCGSLMTPGGPGQLLDVDTTRKAFEAVLMERRAILIGQNIAYDCLVLAVDAWRRGADLLPAIFSMYEDGRVFDTGVAEMLHAIANGHLLEDPRGGKLRDPATKEYGVGYRLSVLVDLVLGRANAKVNDRFRMSYALLEDIPIDQWPPEARDYPIDDAVNTFEVAAAQVKRNRNLHQVSFQTYTAWCLQLSDAHGFRVDPAEVQKLDVRTAARRAEHSHEFLAADLFVRKPCADCKLRRRNEKKAGVGWRDLASITCDACDIKYTDTGNESVNNPLIKTMLADAYGVSGWCGTCDGDGKVPGQTKCKACDGTACEICEAYPECVAGKVPNPKTLRGCPNCDTTGRDLQSAPIPLTPTGEIQTGRDALTESGDEMLINFAAFSEANKIGTTYLPWLRLGITADGRQIPITLRSNVLLYTGRISYSGVVQLLPRKGGVRECIVPSTGCVFISCDYSSLELVTLAQTCLDVLGWSKLAEAMNSGIKVHDHLGAHMMGIPYDEFLRRRKADDKVVVDYRQAAKKGNFGFPGGMGAPKTVLQARKEDFDTTAPDGTIYKGLRFCLLIGGAQQCGEEKVTKWGRAELPPTCKRCIECAEQLRDAWFAKWPEMRDYFKHISTLMDNVGELTQIRSNRIRGGIEFCSAANSYFQGLGADATKLALQRVSREQYTVRSSPLFGTRTILMAHDELIVEAPEGRAHEAAMRLQEIMEGALREFCPDMHAAIEAEPCTMRRWYKGAGPVFENGRLIPWEPKTEQQV